MMSSRMFQLLQEQLNDQRITALITITTHPNRNNLGKKLLMWENRHFYQEDALESEVISRLLDISSPLLIEKKTKLIKVEQGFEAFVEVFLPSPRLIVAGAGHVCEPVVQMASMLGYDVSVVDDRPDFALRERFPLAKEVICEGYMSYFRNCFLNEHTAVLLLTRGHQFDVMSLYELLQREEKVGYIGMIGSRRRIAGVFEQLKDDFPEEAFDRIFTPVGLDIGAETPAEIAVSILAEMLMVRKMRPGTPLSNEVRKLAKLGFRGGGS